MVDSVIDIYIKEIYLADRYSIKKNMVYLIEPYLIVNLFNRKIFYIIDRWPV